MQWYQWGSCWAVQQFPDEFAVETKVNWVNVAANHYQCTREKPNQNTGMLPRRNYSLVWRFLSSQPIESLLVALKFFYLYLLCIRSISVTFLCGWSMLFFFPLLKVLVNSGGMWLCLDGSCVSGIKMEAPRALKTNSLIMVLNNFYEIELNHNKNLIEDLTY